MIMSGSVTVRSESNEILFSVIPTRAARAEVMDLKVLRSAAILAAPLIPCEHPAGKPARRLGLKP